MPRLLPFALLILTSAAAGYGIARIISPDPLPESLSTQRGLPAMPAPPPAGSLILKESGAAAIPEILAALDHASAADLRRLADMLLADPRKRRDLGLWAPLLVRWSEVDGAGLAAFVHGLPQAADREWLEPKAWFAWGASDPAAASAAGAALPKDSLCELIRGMGKKDARTAVDFALRMPDAQLNIWVLSDALKTLPAETVDALLPRAIYEGMRMPLRAAQTAGLVEKDPAAALAAASPSLGYDSRSQVIGQIAEKDPGKAVELLDTMLSSRTKALASLSLARAWAGQDSAAALTWARRDLNGPVRQSALLEIAAITGGASPLEALNLVEEAGWTSLGNFGAVLGGTMEANTFPTAANTAGLLLQQLSELDPGAAKQFLGEHVPQELRAKVAKKAGISLEP